VLRRLQKDFLSEKSKAEGNKLRGGSSREQTKKFMIETMFVKKYPFRGSSSSAGKHSSPPPQTMSDLITKSITLFRGRRSNLSPSESEATGRGFALQESRTSPSFHE
ncbi:unnamed protein product, partial [Brassica rapa subsp. narinosa]